MLEANFWDDSNKSNEVISELNYLKNSISSVSNLKDTIESNVAMLEEVNVDDKELMELLETELLHLEEELDKVEVEQLLNGPYDKLGAIVEIHPGAGGTEAMDWAFMLYRMYTRWCNNKGYKVEILDLQDGEEAGYKSASFIVRGINAYGYLKCEKGVHRLVRISPFDSNARRHTSFSSVYVFPVLDDSIEVEIKPEDLRVDTYRAGGAGGQHVNKTDSAVRFTHIPTGIVVACQTERSQLMNRQTAMSMLKARLYEYYKAEKEKENSKFASEKKGISFGSQIRSYVFQPYTMVKDLRTRYESGNIQGVMDGNLDPFIESFLFAQWKGLPMGDGSDEDDE